MKDDGGTNGARAGRPFEIEDARALRFLRGASFVGDGKLIYSVAALDADREERDTLWLLDPDSGSTRRLAEDLSDVRLPAPSPDGERVAVLAPDADGMLQIHLLSLADGSVRAITRLPQGVTGAPAWSPDGASLAFAARPGEARDPSQPYWVDRVTYRFDALGNLDDAVTDLFLVDVETGSLRQLTDDRSSNAEPAWSPDGRSLAYLASFQPDRSWDFLPQLHVLDVATTRSRALVDEWGGAFAAAWHAGGERVAFVGTPAAVGYFTKRAIHIWTIDADGGEPECRTASVAAGVGMSVLHSDLPVYFDLSAVRLLVDREDAYATAPTGKGVTTCRVSLSGPESLEPALEHDGSSFLLDFNARAGVLAAVTSIAEPPDLVLDSRRVTALNRDVLGEVARLQVRVLEVVAADGVRTEAWALTPPGDGPWPTVLCLHGGPHYAWGSIFSIDFDLLVGAGFAVLLDNYRGSGGYGEEFAALLTGEWGRQASLDHHAALDEAIRAGIAIPDRLGVYGSSAGGYATCWLVATSDRFKAGVAETPFTSLSSMYYLGDCDKWIRDEFDGDPAEAADAYREWSPLTYAANCTTPLLLIVAEGDLRVHPTEADQFYRALKSRGAPTAMLRLPGASASHAASINGPVAAREAQNEALTSWFRDHLSDEEATR